MTNIWTRLQTQITKEWAEERAMEMKMMGSMKTLVVVRLSNLVVNTINVNTAAMLTCCCCTLPKL